MKRVLLCLAAIAAFAAVGFGQVIMSPSPAPVSPDAVMIAHR